MDFSAQSVFGEMKMNRKNFKSCNFFKNFVSKLIPDVEGTNAMINRSRLAKIGWLVFEMFNIF